MKVKIITKEDLPEPGSIVKFRIKNTTQWRVGHRDAEGSDFIEEPRGIIYRYSWNQIDEYMLWTIPEVEI
ncbi:hypothetical protein ACFP1I_18085 [Dyadobacter subterraneus]|uniref:Uncharacterized protein n=1 Tax=Dyadobacter subterraneus TaxID=2773304 RepID=A0ABR9WKP5_9BACT|nr:hypothetical protein [Dyadobacter subterraneus]MBE9464734.1 hypothetical protein [Dyadobacter subterraneus]